MKEAACPAHAEQSIKVLSCVWSFDPHKSPRRRQGRLEFLPFTKEEGSRRYRDLSVVPASPPSLNTSALCPSSWSSRDMAQILGFRGARATVPQD